MMDNLNEANCHYCGEKLPHEKCSEARKKPEPGAEEVHDAFIADICSSIDNAVKILDSKEKITLDRINRPKKPKQLSASEPTALPKGIWEELEGSVCAGKKLTLEDRKSVV